MSTTAPLAPAELDQIRTSLKELTQQMQEPQMALLPAQMQAILERLAGLTDEDLRTMAPEITGFVKPLMPPVDSVHFRQLDLHKDGPTSYLPALLACRVAFVSKDVSFPANFVSPILQVLQNSEKLEQLGYGQQATTILDSILPSRESIAKMPFDQKEALYQKTSGLVDKALSGSNTEGEQANRILMCRANLAWSLAQADESYWKGVQAQLAKALESKPAWASVVIPMYERIVQEASGNTGSRTKTEAFESMICALSERMGRAREKSMLAFLKAGFALAWPQKDAPVELTAGLPVLQAYFWDLEAIGANNAALNETQREQLKGWVKTYIEATLLTSESARKLTLPQINGRYAKLNALKGKQTDFMEAQAPKAKEFRASLKLTEIYLLGVSLPRVAPEGLRSVWNTETRQMEFISGTDGRDEIMREANGHREDVVYYPSCLVMDLAQLAQKAPSPTNELAGELFRGVFFPMLPVSYEQYSQMSKAEREGAEGVASALKESRGPKLERTEGELYFPVHFAEALFSERRGQCNCYELVKLLGGLVHNSEKLKYTPQQRGELSAMLDRVLPQTPELAQKANTELVRALYNSLSGGGWGPAYVPLKDRLCRVALTGIIRQDGVSCNPTAERLINALGAAAAVPQSEGVAQQA